MFVRGFWPRFFGVLVPRNFCGTDLVLARGFGPRFFGVLVPRKGKWEEGKGKKGM